MLIKKTIRLFVVGGFFWAASGGAVAQFLLNDTGITQCGHATAGGDPRPPISCAGTGQDGELGRDVTLADTVDGDLGFSFVAVCNNGDEAGFGSCPLQPLLGKMPARWRCNRDRVTGLLWEIKLDGFGLFGMRTRYTNVKPDQAGYGSDTDVSRMIQEANATSLCGRSDWRLPEAREVQSLIHYGREPGVMIDEAWFPFTAGHLYWTATDANAAASRQPNPNNAWTVDMSGGVLWHAKRTDKNRVRLVSGEPRNPTPSGSSRYVLSADGSEVLDQSTQLIWRHCSQGQAMDAGCTGAPTMFDREKVLQEVWPAGWRLPNIKELSSIISTQHSYPSLDPAWFPNSYVEGAYWTGSMRKDTGYLWFVGIGTGAVIFDRHNFGAVRLVRNAPAP